jgi:hypothetical protein
MFFDMTALDLSHLGVLGSCELLNPTAQMAVFHIQFTGKIKWHYKSIVVRLSNYAVFVLHSFWTLHAENGFGSYLHPSRRLLNKSSTLPRNK